MCVCVCWCADVWIPFRSPRPCALTPSPAGASLLERCRSPCGCVCRPQPFSRSTILSRVDAGARAAFIRDLATWLPHKRVGAVIYRGTRDGLTPAAFHRQCDGQGATLTLLRSSTGYVFGGYTSVPWCSPPDGGYRYETVGAGDAFLFSVVGPFGPVTLFPLKPGGDRRGMESRHDAGPVFGANDLYVSNRHHDPCGRFDDTCCTGLGGSPWAVSSFVDTLGKGKESLTGTWKFTPEEMEVYAVV